MEQRSPRPVIASFHQADTGTAHLLRQVEQLRQAVVDVEPRLLIVDVHAGVVRKLRNHCRVDVDCAGGGLRIRGGVVIGLLTKYQDLAISKKIFFWNIQKQWICRLLITENSSRKALQQSFPLFFVFVD